MGKKLTMMVKMIGMNTGIHRLSVIVDKGFPCGRGRWYIEVDGYMTGEARWWACRNPTVRGHFG